MVRLKGFKAEAFRLMEEKAGRNDDLVDGGAFVELEVREACGGEEAYLLAFQRTVVSRETAYCRVAVNAPFADCSDFEELSPAFDFAFRLCAVDVVAVDVEANFRWRVCECEVVAALGRKFSGWDAREAAPFGLFAAEIDTASVVAMLVDVEC